MRLSIATPTRTLLALALACALPAAQAARPGGPVLTFPLEKLGFEPIPAQWLTLGGAMFTLHFVDSTHLLFTYHSHGLLTRIQDDPIDDNDRNVSAVLLELPSGRVVARTRWRTHDHSRYLWSIGHGRFILRSRDRLTLLDPLAALAAGHEAFEQTPFLDSERPVAYIQVSPGGDLISVETSPPKSSGDQEDRPSGSRSLVETDFFRNVATPQNPAPRPHLSGAVASAALIGIPATAEGYLSMFRESASVWLFDFHPHAGKSIELSPFDTTCAPRPIFITRTDFVAFGCHGGTIRNQLSGFNLRGEEPWVQTFQSSYLDPEVISAPDSGRFVLSRVLTTNTVLDPQSLVPEELTAQQIDVLQGYDGRNLLRVQATPIERAGQNYDLSPDGMSFVVVRNGNIELYHLPELSKADHHQLDLAQQITPPRNDAPILLRSLATTASVTAPALPPLPAEAQPEPASAPVQAAATPAAPSQPSARIIQYGDIQTGERRAAPTLYDPAHPKPE